MFKNYLYIVLLSVFIFSCEKIETDVNPIDTTPIDDSDQIIYTWQGTDIVVDVFALQKNKEVTSLTISEFPAHGKAEFIEGNLLSYTPNESIVEADDRLTVEVKTKNNLTRKEVFFIKIKSEGEELPCHNGAKADKISIEANKLAIVDVLSNDAFCESEIDEISLNIKVLPKKGTAVFKNKKIEYTPSPSFTKDNDVLVYEFFATRKDGSKEKFSAALNINILDKSVVTNPCVLKLTDDFIPLSPNFSVDSVVINCLGNDKLCGMPSFGVLTISEKPKVGSVKVLSNKNLIVYYPKNNIQNGDTDEFSYKFAQNGQIQEAKVKVKKWDGNGNSTSKVTPDFFQISLAKPTTEMKKDGYLLIDVFKNDVIGGLIKEFNLKETKPNTGKFEKNSVLGIVKYFPLNGKFEKEVVSFTYEVVDSKDKKLTAPVIIKFVD
jgi:hypothetical protein